ncbi:MAG TPA: tRNA (adenosine(37)-N6)-dimethylallyltransferase MiaA [Flavobacteriales bacterium]|nr:tRNA (adenosine(37)-N6)-dimethylallyltransferase MiaA [Flavobacteriales bacterium]
MSSPKKTVFIVCGPTAVGKTGFAIELAKHLKTEIINADSRQVYSELNIGVARPSEKQLAIIKHHLMACFPVTRLYGAGDFEKDALNITHELFKTHDTVVVCGGTGMYIKAFCEGLDDLPRADVLYRLELKQRFEKNGIKDLQVELRTKDPAAVEIIDFENPQRLMRALEIMHVGKQLYSDVLKGNKTKRDFNIVKIALNMPREVLYKRINDRVENMVNEGLVQEVKQLMPYREHNALKTVGYTEMFDYLDGKIKLDDAVQKIQQHTRNYAKRQLTWFRADKDIKWFEPTNNKMGPLEYTEIINFVDSRMN